MITQQEIKKVLLYKKGHLYWRKTGPGIQRPITEPAGYLHSRGYIHIQINYKIYKEHRLIFLLHRGYLPEELDHKNNDKTCNYMWNLRPSTRAQNCSNTKLRKDNTSGIKGVSWRKNTKKWYAQIQINKQKINIGYFKTLKEATLAVQIVRKQQHKEFAHNG